MAVEKVLFFYTSNFRAIALETQLLQLRAIGLEVFVCTIASWGDLHDFLDQQGFKVFVLERLPNKGILRHISVARQLACIARKMQIDLIISHLQPANLAASLAKKFLINHVKLITFRHHDFSRNQNSFYGDKLINIFSPLQVVPARSIARHMFACENVTPGRIQILKYSYDFDEYGNPFPEAAANIKTKYGSPLVSLVSRMVPEKRHDLIIDAISYLHSRGVDVRCIFLDKGGEESDLKAKVQALGLEERIYFVGFVKNVTDYVYASDILVHPSVAEASCSVVKEAGRLSVPVIACSEVGDFDEYLVDGHNSLLLTVECGAIEWANKIEALLKNPSLRCHLGKNLSHSVFAEFSDSIYARNRLRELIDSLDTL